MEKDVTCGNLNGVRQNEWRESQDEYSRSCKKVQVKHIFSEMKCLSRRFSAPTLLKNARKFMNAIDQWKR